MTEGQTPPLPKPSVGIAYAGKVIPHAGMGADWDTGSDLWAFTPQQPLRASLKYCRVIMEANNDDPIMSKTLNYLSSM